MDYTHDVFISYRREHLWTPWVRDHFKILLRSYLQQELARPPDIFVDEIIEPGADWVDELGEHLARSRVMVAIFSRDYFGSDYCLHELDLMVERSDSVQGAVAGACRLIIPVVVHDGECIPDPVKRIQPSDFKSVRIAEITKNTQPYQEFSEKMKTLAPSILKALGSAPAFADDWIASHKARFASVYNAQVAGGRLDPNNFARPALGVPLSPPRLGI